MTQNDEIVKSELDNNQKKTQRRLFGRYTKRYFFTKQPVRNQKNGFWRYIRGIEAPINNGKELDAISHSLYVRMISAAGYMTHNYGLIPGTLDYWAERLSVTKKQIRTALHKLEKLGLLKQTGGSPNAQRYIVNYSLFREGSFDQDKADEFFVSLAIEGTKKCKTGHIEKCGKTASTDVLSDPKIQTGHIILENRAHRIEENRTNNNPNVNELMLKEIKNITNITHKCEAYKYKRELQELAASELQYDHLVVNDIDVVETNLHEIDRTAQIILNRTKHHILPDELLSLLFMFEDSINDGSRKADKLTNHQKVIAAFRGMAIKIIRDEIKSTYVEEQPPLLDTQNNDNEHEHETEERREEVEAQGIESYPANGLAMSEMSQRKDEDETLEGHEELNAQTSAIYDQLKTTIENSQYQDHIDELTGSSLDGYMCQLLALNYAKHASQSNIVIDNYIDDFETWLTTKDRIPELYQIAN